MEIIKKTLENHDKNFDEIFTYLDELIKEQEDLAEQMYYVGIIQLIISSIVGGANSECLSMQVYTKVALANSVVSIGIMFFMDDDTRVLRFYILSNII